MLTRVLIFALLGAVLVGTAQARLSATPKDLLLQKSDLPAGAKRTAFKTRTGTLEVPRIVHGSAAAVAYKFRAGSRTETVLEALGVISSTAQAKAVYRRLQKDASAGAGFSKLLLPRLGSQQSGFGIAAAPIAAGIAIVRAGKIVWEVAVLSFPGMGKRKLHAEVAKYAAKAKHRAG